MPVVERIGTGRPVLMIHGSPGDRGTWAAVAERTPAGFASWIVELPCHGRQPQHTTGLAGYLEDLRAELEAATRESGGPVVVAGLSVGGYLALRLARDWPESVARVVACAAFPSIDASGQAMRREMAAALRQGETSPASMYASWVDLLVAPTDRTPETERLLRRSLADETAERIACVADAAAEIGELGAGVRAIAAPLTVIHGRGDPLVPVAEVEAMRAWAKNATVDVLETTSHVLTLSHPEQVARRVFAPPA